MDWRFLLDSLSEKSYDDAVTATSFELQVPQVCLRDFLLVNEKLIFVYHPIINSTNSSFLVVYSNNATNWV